MSTVSLGTERGTSQETGRSTRRGATAGVVLSEWTKLRSLRSTRWALSLLVLLTLGFTALLLGLTMAQWDTATAAQRQSLTSDPGRAILGSGFQFSQLAVCILGVLLVTGEYGSGTIRASLLAVPKRTPMLVAKAGVFAAVVFLVGEIAAFPSFFLGQAIIRSRIAISLSDPGVLRAVIGGGLYLSLLGTFAIAIGTLVRHTAAGVTGVIGFVLILAPLTQLLPGDIGRYVHAYMPSEAGSLIASPHRVSGGVLSPWQGLGVFCLWTLALLLAATFSLKRRDA
ncbi:MAG TPA: hypothetical protein VGB75_06760 [Jatrophihabitans sp.]|jgi:ABC-type transport system involved in multi-copper enzyme maturation permease subunit|uniref:ABC transporter permease n=1 Tax=Jatrophihabitans sp. TaxID=1932789 RepID=UPI002EE59B20